MEFNASAEIEVDVVYCMTLLRLPLAYVSESTVGFSSMPIRSSFNEQPAEEHLHEWFEYIPHCRHFNTLDAFRH